jgi:hypothetical protein
MTEIQFLIMSPAKTGSTWLAANLNIHPQVFIPAIKEVNYFSFLNKCLALDWYREVFRPGSGCVKGDASPCYALLPSSTIREIHALFPDIKLIYLIRDPVERAWSHAKHNFVYREGNFRSQRGSIDDVPEATWLESFTHPWPVSHGDYLGQLRRWTDVFPREQLFVGFFDQIATDPQGLLRDVLKFLGIQAEPDWTGYPLFEKILEGPRKPLLPSMRTHLRALHAARSRQLADFLHASFQITCPPEWSQAQAPVPQEASAAITAIFGFSCDDEYLADLLESNPAAQIILIEEGFCGYNLIWHRGRLFAFPQKLGPIAAGSMREEQFERYAQQAEALTATTLPELKDMVRHISQLKEGSTDAVYFALDYLNFNLLLYKGRFLALAQRLGPMDLRGLNDETLKRLESRQEAYSAADLDQLKETLRRAAKNNAICRPRVRLLVEGYAGYNLVSYRGRYFAFRQHLGARDLREIIDGDFCQYEQRQDGLTATTLVELKERVDRVPVKLRTRIRRFLTKGVRVVASLPNLVGRGKLGAEIRSS